MKKSVLLRVALAGIVVACLTTVVCPTAMADDEKEALKIYKAAQKELNEERYKKAAASFKKVYQKYGETAYTADALYWRAFALYRVGGKRDLRDARDALAIALEKHPTASTHDDASALYYRVLGQLASQGDADAAEQLADQSDEIGSDKQDGYDTETKLMAMEALLNMNSERALPILKKVVEDRRPRSAELRKKAMFLLSQQRTEESVDIMMRAAKEDPDSEVRQQAVFWLSQSGSEKAIVFLEEIVTSTNDRALQEKAIFALSQFNNKRSAEILRRIATDKNMHMDSRGSAIHWLGQTGDDNAADFLIDLYEKIGDRQLQEKIIFGVSQHGSERSAKWLTDLAKDTSRTTEERKQALFWAGQQRHFDVADLVGLYNADRDVEFREHVIFVLSQRHDNKAFDVMLNLARKEKNAELKKKFLFWIGQSGDPRAADFLLEIINE